MDGSEIDGILAGMVHGIVPALEASSVRDGNHKFHYPAVVRQPG